MPTQTSLKFSDICDAIASSLEALSSIKRVQSYNEITDGINTYPMAQVYVEEVRPKSDTQMTAFQRGILHLIATIHIDVYVRALNGPGLDEIQAETTDIMDQVIEMLQGKTRPYFGKDGILGFTWRCYRTVFQYSNGYYAGCRFIITMEMA